jgi:hypothetical protein
VGIVHPGRRSLKEEEEDEEKRWEKKRGGCRPAHHSWCNVGNSTATALGGGTLSARSMRW